MFRRPEQYLSTLTLWPEPGELLDCVHTPSPPASFVNWSLLQTHHDKHGVVYSVVSKQRQIQQTNNAKRK